MDIQGKRVLLFGDSQMQGLGNHLPALLRAQGASDVGVSAHPGLSLKLAYERFPTASAGYDVVLVSFGGNNPPSTRTTAVTYMDRLLAQLGDREVLWISVLPAADPALQVGRAKMERWQKEYLPTRGVVVLDGRALASGIRRADGLHLTSAGYRVFAGRVAEAVQRAGGVIAPLAVAAVGAIIGAAIAWWVHG
jgi:lysophospholipase L1-like esterase